MSTRENVFLVFEAAARCRMREWKKFASLRSFVCQKVSPNISFFLRQKFQKIISASLSCTAHVRFLFAYREKWKNSWNSSCQAHKMLSSTRQRWVKLFYVLSSERHPSCRICTHSTKGKKLSFFFPPQPARARINDIDFLPLSPPPPRRSHFIGNLKFMKKYYPRLWFEQIWRHKIYVQNKHH